MKTNKSAGKADNRPDELQINNITFEDLFDLEEIQQLQDQFADATGVASIITQTNGTPITKPSNFCRLCSEIIRKTEKGRANCYKSDALIGKLNPSGPAIQRCMSGGLYDAGAGISVGGKHIANWLIGQVRDERQTEDDMRRYAREIGADEDEVADAFSEVTSMTFTQFEKISKMLFALSNQLSQSAYNNILEARHIEENRHAEAERRKIHNL